MISKRVYTVSLYQGVPGWFEMGRGIVRSGTWPFTRKRNVFLRVFFFGRAKAFARKSL